MPLGFERLNERTTRPNALINFIKPLPGSPTIALDILNAVAARCYPIMKANHIAVMALEEYPPNPEFVGRNFNAGEVVQLVLRTRGGHWLSVKQVEMVMMHELAHCKQMNHSKSFWQVRDAYAGELRGLWAKGYRGEGLWGRGRELEGGGLVNEDDALSLDDVQSLCGGTYRSRGKKRKRGKEADKTQLSYAERRQRRILRKFGAGGTSLGADDEVKMELEAGKKAKGKPRVAKSARGRELRAAAALARFENTKVEEEPDVKIEISDDDSASDYDDDGFDGEAAKDFNGKELRDEKGNGLVKICEDEDQEDVHVKQEMDELQELHQVPITKFTKSLSRDDKNGGSANLEGSRDSQEKSKAGSKATTKEVRRPNTPKEQPRQKKEPVSRSKPEPRKGNAPILSKNVRTSTPSSAEASRSNTPSVSASRACPACSLVNQGDALRCIACSNVLMPERVPGRWKCQSLACRGGAYINAGDCGICGLCGGAKPKR